MRRRDDKLASLLARVRPEPDDASAASELAESQELAAALAVADVMPPAAAGFGLCDLAAEPADDRECALRLLPGELLQEFAEETLEQAGPDIFTAGFWGRSCGDGSGFASGAAADQMRPGSTLAQFAADAWACGLDKRCDDELIGVMRAARRLGAWAAALEMTAVGDLMRRRLEQEAAGQARVAEHASDEIAAALTLTGRSASLLSDRALALRERPATMRALARGDIDLPRALVIADETAGLDQVCARAVEAAIVPLAHGMTTGELRAATRRAVHAADPDRARQRKEEAKGEARVERWDEPAGTAGLAGRDLDPVGALAADQRLTAIARQLQKNGAEGGIDRLRALAFLALLTGQDPVAAAAASHITQASDQKVPAGAAPVGTAPANPAGAAPAGARNAPATNTAAADAQGSGAAKPPVEAAVFGLAGTVNLTMPLATWLGRSSAPGEVAGRGVFDAGDSRALAALLAEEPRTRWCLTLTDRAGRPVAHGCARGRPPEYGPPSQAPPGQAGAGRDGPGKTASMARWLTGIAVIPLARGGCDHAHETPAYRPPPRLRHLIRARQRTCSFPGCRRPATRTDLDHSIPWEEGGKTCECNLAPLCRHHHRCKQAEGWRLEQPEPGTLIWHSPSGRSYATGPSTYAV